MPEPRDHVHNLRVYYEDTDAGGVVYYANYLRFIERARTEMLREAGFDHIRLLQERGVAFFVKSVNADYLAPARLDDSLEVHTRVVNLNGGGADRQARHRRLGEVHRQTCVPQREWTPCSAACRVACVHAGISLEPEAGQLKLWNRM